MTTRHQITYTIYEGKLVTGHNPLMPIVRVYSDSMAYGDVIFPIPQSYEADIGSLTCKVYLCETPAINELRWIRTGSDLYTSSVVDFSGLLVGTKKYKLTFKFLPASVTPSNNDNYALEFFLTIDHDIPEIFSPKLIININNRLKF